MKKSPPRDQLDLFPGEAKPLPPREEVRAIVTSEQRALAEKVPSWLRFGTSSFTFPGWAGVLYEGKPSQKALIESGLTAYASHPLLRTVGIDRSYYGPLTEEDLAGYAELLSGASGFRAVSKVWEEISTFIFPKHPRFGERAGKPNPHFLDLDRFFDVVAPYRKVFAEYTGPFVVEVSPFPREVLLSARSFVKRMDAFLTGVSERAPELRIAFEVRNAELLVPEYFDMLRKHRAAHVFTYWTAMPPLRLQLARQGAFTADFSVIRLMLPPFKRYDEQRATFEPFDKIVAPQPQMRTDTVELALAARAAGASDVFVLVNNKAEGSSPLTAFALAEMVVQALHPAEKV